MRRLVPLLFLLPACANGADLPTRDAGARSSEGRDAGPGGSSDAGPGAAADAGAGGSDAGPGSTGGRCATPSECGSDEVCDFTAVGCGAGLGVCRARPTTCPRGDGVVCGCDGALYDSECEANMAGAGVDPGNACLDCGPMDDWDITGSCPVPYGFRWNGSACVEVPQGCACTGADCDRFMNFQRCEAFAAACGG